LTSQELMPFQQAIAAANAYQYAYPPNQQQQQNPYGIYAGPGGPTMYTQNPMSPLSGEYATNIPTSPGGPSLPQTFNPMSPPSTPSMNIGIPISPPGQQPGMYFASYPIRPGGPPPLQQPQPLWTPQAAAAAAAYLQAQNQAAAAAVHAISANSIMGAGWKGPGVGAGGVVPPTPNVSPSNVNTAGIVPGGWTPYVDEGGESGVTYAALQEIEEGEGEGEAELRKQCCSLKKGKAHPLLKRKSEFSFVAIVIAPPHLPGGVTLKDGVILIKFSVVILSFILIFILDRRVVVFVEEDLLRKNATEMSLSTKLHFRDRSKMPSEPNRPEPTPFDLTTLHDRYFAVRHGQSEANVQSIIISDPSQAEVACHDEDDVLNQKTDQAAQNLLTQFPPTTPLQIHTSPFLRTLQTAQIITAHFPSSTLHINHNLRERNFGSFEGTSTTNYETVWSHDARHEPISDVETPESVCRDAVGVVKELERTTNGQVHVLVSHGDRLQILETAFRGVEPWMHRMMTHLGTAEVRELGGGS
ncbi:hypothetical protein HK104_005756, partial [Borealophlyctis nickersoniae]